MYETIVLFIISLKKGTCCRFFVENEKLNEALGAVEYTHGLLDAGVYMNLFEVLENKDLFVFKKD